jgi:glycosyltransferase involved in cell wall biosynthesis
MKMPAVRVPMKVLLEMRPALDGHAGIPQETRLLFRGLQQLPGIEPIALIQHHAHVLGKGLPVDVRKRGRLPAHKQLDRLSRVVISVEQQRGNPYLASARMALRQLLGVAERLDHFDPTHFVDFVWRSMFARTLHADDLASVTSAQFRTTRVPWKGMHYCALTTRKLGYALYPRLDTSGIDVMIAETPYPGRVSSGTKLVVRYHDAIPVLMPHTISDKAGHQARHYCALKRNVADGAWFACVSESTRQDLLSLFPEVERRAVNIPNMISRHYFAAKSEPEIVPEIVRNRINTKIGKPPSRLGAAAPLRYLLMVSTIEPRKNHETLLSAWERLRATGESDLKLVLVGSPGWHYEEIVRKFLPWIQRGELKLLEDVPPAELRELYRHAVATICPSVYEGFDFSGIEAMRCGSPVVASDIKVHREIFGAPAEYFSPYDSSDAAAAIERVISPGRGTHREQLVALGAEHAVQYMPERILPLWQEFFARHASSVAGKESIGLLEQRPADEFRTFSRFPEAS